MNEKAFLSASSVPTGSDGAAADDSKPKNWSGNLIYSAKKLHYPRTPEEVQEVVRQCKTVKALGSRHSFNRIADTTENLVCLQELNKVVHLDKAARTVTVEAGVRYGELAPYLHENGLALPNLASLPHITVIGACATATHGSGIQNGSLATAVSAIEVVTGAGELVTISRQKDGGQFYGAVVGLGALGVVTQVTLDLLPAFDMKQVVYCNLPMHELKHHFFEIQSMGYSVSLFTDWTNKTINEVWIKSRVEEGDDSAPGAELFGARLAARNMHPIAGESAENVTEQLGVPGPWHERLPHFRMGFKPSAGKELQSEYFVPVEHAYSALMAMEKLQEKISPHLFISEIRTIAADDFWMSPFYKESCVAFHTTWKQDVATVMKLLPLIEAQLAPFHARPHWGKLFTMPPAAVRARYKKLEDFIQLTRQYDPEGKFRNEFLDHIFYPSGLR